MKKVYRELLKNYNNILNEKDFTKKDFSLHEIVFTIMNYEVKRGNMYDIKNTKLYNIMLDYDFMEWLQEKTKNYDEFTVILDNFHNSKIHHLRETIADFLSNVYTMNFNDNEYIINILDSQKIAMKLENIFQGSELIVKIHGYNKLSVVIYDIYDIEDFDDIQSFNDLAEYCNDNNLNIDTLKIAELELN